MNNKIKYLIRVSQLFICCNSNAQQISADSLRNILINAKEDTNKVNTLISLSTAVINTSPDSSVIFSKQALQLAEKQNWEIGIGKSNRSLGASYNVIGEYDDALHCYSKALAIWEKLEKEVASNLRTYILSLKSVTIGNIGIVYMEKGDYSKALNNYFTALKMDEALGDKYGISRHLFNIGIVYSDQAYNPKALDYYFKSLRMNEAVGNKGFMATNLGSIGLVYWTEKDFTKALNYLYKALKIDEELGNKTGVARHLGNIGNVYNEQNDYARALDFYFRALKMDEELGNKNGISRHLSNIGVVYMSRSNFPMALDYCMKALKMAERIGDKYGIGLNLGNIGSIYTSLKKYNEAKEYLDKALAMTKEIGDKYGSKDWYLALSELDSARGNYKNAYSNYKFYTVYKDSIDNEETQKKTIRTEMQYEFDKKEAASRAEQDKKDAIASEEASRQRSIRNSSIAAFAVVLLFSIAVMRQRNKVIKEKKRSDELLLNILPAETAEELKNTGTTKAKDFEEVTVMFTDFKNFTAMSEKMDAQELVNQINYCYSAFDSIISRHGIEKIKTIGDSYMCAGGLPVANKTNAEDIVRAAIEIRDFMLTEKQIRDSQNKPFFEIRIGCHTGPVVAGIVGIKKFAYDIWGDTVNIASRMESGGEAGKINISGSTRELVKDIFKCEYRGKIEAKNKGMIDMYYVSRLHMPDLFAEALA